MGVQTDGETSPVRQVGYKNLECSGGTASMANVGALLETRLTISFSDNFDNAASYTFSALANYCFPNPKLQMRGPTFARKITVAGTAS